MSFDEIKPVRVLFTCTSVGLTNRGIESFFREAFDHLKKTPGLEIMLAKGGGVDGPGEKRVWCLSKTNRLAALLGRATGRSTYAVEQWTSFLPTVQLLRRFRPDVVFSSDANVFFLLRRFRLPIGLSAKLLYSNGGPCGPPFPRYDAVHQVAPYYLEQALAAGEPPEKHSLVPYGIHVPDGAPVSDPARKRALRERLNLPVDRPIILSVGWIAAQHKRMDYVVREIGGRWPVGSTPVGGGRWAVGGDTPTHRRTDAPTTDKPFLVLLGNMTAESDEIVALARRELGEGNFTARSVPYDEVADYYRTADVFTLASLQEGFGRVYLEALLHGLPVIAHDHPVMRYVLGDQGTLVDLSPPGALARELAAELARPFDAESAARRRESVRARFSWPVLAPQYREMFRACAQKAEKLKS